MKPGACRPGLVWFLVITLILLIFFGLIDSPPAAAQSAGEYFQISYSATSLSQNEVNGDAVFSATLTGKATCIKDLPVSVSEAIINSRIVAKNGVTGTVVTLNPGYVLTIKPFPSKAGDTIEMSQSVSLQFQTGAESGNYEVTAELIEAKVKVAFAWAGVTEYLPRSQPIGSVKYVSPGVSSAPAPLPVELPARPSPEPVLPTAPALLPEPAPTPAQPESSIVWWVWLIVAIALVTTMVNIFFILWYRAARGAGR